MKNIQSKAVIVTLSLFLATSTWHVLGEGDDRKSSLSSKDKAFIKEAAEGGAMEVQMGNIGEKQGTSESVKSLSAMLIKDHTAANAELGKLASAKGYTAPDSPSLKEKAMLKMLEAKSGDSFDKAFAKDAVDDHKKDIVAFEKASNDLDDPDLKAFAAKTVPTLKEHLSMAEKAASGK